MKKCFLAIAMLASYMAMAQPQLRDMVVVVYPQFPEATVKFLSDFSESLRSDGYKSAADLLKSYSEGGYGSGFLYKASNNQVYIVTNKHVVAQAQTVTIEFSQSDGSTKRYENCEIVSLDDNLDLALLEFPQGTEINRGLDIADRTPQDGDDVWSAGFPGLGSKPTWQLGKGIISNSALRLGDLIDPSVSVVLQHTAQVDPGSSGGPLLIRDKVTNNYAVVGVNSWKAIGRENANFAIPASTLQAFVARSIAPTTLSLNEQLEQSAQAFAVASVGGYKSLVPFVSHRFLEQVSVEHFYELYKAASPEASKEIVDLFTSGNPVEAVRVALADEIYRNLAKKSNPLVFQRMDSNVSDAAPANVMFESGTKSVESRWVYEQKKWRLNRISVLDLNAVGKSGIATDFGYRFAVELGMGIPLNGMDKSPSFEIRLSKTYKTFIINGMSLAKGTQGTVKQDNYNATEQLVGDQKFWDFALDFGLQLPIYVGKVYVIPNAMVLFGNTFADASGVFVGYKFGVQGAYKLGKFKYLMVGLDFKTKNYFSADFISSSGDNYYIDRSKHSRTLNLRVGISF